MSRESHGAPAEARLQICPPKTFQGTDVLAQRLRSNNATKAAEMRTAELEKEVAELRRIVHTETSPL